MFPLILSLGILSPYLESHLPSFLVSFVAILGFEFEAKNRHNGSKTVEQTRRELDFGGD